MMILSIIKIINGIIVVNKIILVFLSLTNGEMLLDLTRLEIGSIKRFSVIDVQLRHNDEIVVAECVVEVL
jgi:hypothetical protein